MNKTTICSVVFLDIVEYSKKSVAEQIRLKNQFNSLIAHAIRNVPITDRIILDTGDGAAISFLGDPEDALWAAMKIRDSVVAGQDSPFFLRTGINLGPVRLVQDINKQPNIIGDGINVAQRIMNFAQPNQILVSRTFYDVISGVTTDYAKLFEYQGARTDKHVREHEIYAVRNEVGQEEAFRAKPVQTEKARPWWQNRTLLLKKIFPAAA
ncbi:MAG TPA: adenylate/guanylate cyclase domain-containing protein, partial [Burkholderiales bacterium]|nr:adenylate/guanylate cyclase domain-containing protein [Burkholderiales bacterium]